jgi:N-acetyltransferase
MWYDPHMRDELVEAVLGRLAVERPAPDHAGLRSIYASWCRSIPFDNTLKLIHTVEGLPGPLPGSTAESFFGEWLEHGTGGTCWAGNGALHDFLAELGFVVERALATMLPRPDLQGPNHGSVIVTLDDSRYIADASILSREPIRLEPGRQDAAGPLPRLTWLEDKPAVVWRTLTAPDGFPCRIDRIGASGDEWDASTSAPQDGVPSTTSSTSDCSAGARASAWRRGSGSCSRKTAHSMRLNSWAQSARDSWSRTSGSPRMSRGEFHSTGPYRLARPDQLPDRRYRKIRASTRINRMRSTTPPPI